MSDGGRTRDNRDNNGGTCGFAHLVDNLKTAGKVIGNAGDNAR